MEFPETPVGERKLLPSPAKANQQKKIKRMSTIDQDENSHRTYETIEELRSRLKQGYHEAKKQREKYLNLSPNKQNENDKCINGYRSKTRQQPVFKNYKQITEIPAKTNGVVKFSNQVKASSPNGDSNVIDNSDSFAAELSNALKRTNDNNSEETVNRSPSGYSLKSSLKSSSGVSTGSIDDPKYESSSLSNGSMSSSHETPVKSVGNATPKSNHKTSKDPGNLSRKNSFKNLMKRSDSKNSMGRRESLKNNKKSPEITRNDIDNVVENQYSKQSGDDDEVLDAETEPSQEDGALGNVMDMLANW